MADARQHPDRRARRLARPAAPRSSRSRSAATASSPAARRGLRTRRPGIPVKVVDTVGAGDTFSAALLAGLHDRGLLGAAARPQLRAVDAETLDRLLDWAAEAASITCSRRGADPPTADELRRKTSYHY